MTKAKAIKEFLSSFGMPAYPNTAVPEDVVYPWMTYDQVFDYELSGETNMTVDLWFHTESEAVPNAKVDEIFVAIGRGGKLISFDGGAIWLKPGTPWCNAISTGDNTTKRRQLNITLEYI